ncbi:putative uncharacterized protein C8orf44 [Plecturocebus cupreus]
MQRSCQGAAGRHAELPHTQQREKVQHGSNCLPTKDTKNQAEIGQVQWFTPVIPALREAKAGRSPEVGSSRPAWPIGQVQATTPGIRFLLLHIWVFHSSKEDHWAPLAPGLQAALGSGRLKPEANIVQQLPATETKALGEQANSPLALADKTHLSKERTVHKLSPQGAYPVEHVCPALHGDALKHSEHGKGKVIKVGDASIWANPATPTFRAIGSTLASIP